MFIKRSEGKINHVIDTKDVSIDDKQTREAMKKTNKTVLSDDEKTVKNVEQN